MKYTQTTPCKECQFLKSMAHGFTMQRLREFAETGTFPCHKSATCDEETLDYNANGKSVACAGALIFLEKRNQPNQMMRISERLGMYDYTKLDMSAQVR